MIGDQKFCFKLVNSLLDALRAVCQWCEQRPHIEFVLEDETRFEPRTCFDKIIKAGAFEMLKLIDPAAEVYSGEPDRLSVKASESLWIVDSIDGAKAFACGSKV